MKTTFAMLVAGCALLLASCEKSAQQEAPLFDEPVQQTGTPSGFVIKRGTNLSHWLSQNEPDSATYQTRATRIDENDIKRLSELGFDHVRIPIDEVQFWDEDGNKIPETWDMLTNALDLCMKYNIRAIVDLHIIRSHYFNSDFEGVGKNTLFTDEAEQQKLCDLWAQLSQALKDYPVSMVAYEFMNEPVADDHEQWNQLITKVHASLRALEPERVMVIGSNKWQGHWTFPYLKIPENDPNIYLAVHYYNPMMVTHQNAWWTEANEYKGPIQYPGKIISDEEFAKLTPEQQQKFAQYNEEWNKERLAQQLNDCVVVANKLGLPLVCTEWGVYEHADREPSMAWTKDMLEVFDAGNIAWSTWCYDADFGFWTPDDSGWKDEELAKVLMTGKPLEVPTPAPAE